ncbi:MAG: biopolymer transporter ExbD [Planctomycetes bacterium]|nr:biopolymer transporter ExbD [Planctomycetota bacterium]
MAGASIGDSDDNPVAINVTPLIDVIFCLCVFFMCSFRFKQLEGKFDTWLPKNKGAEGMPVDSVIEEVRVALFWDEANQKVVRKIGRRIVDENSELQQLISDAFADYKRLGKTDIGLTIDADKAVPWDSVVNVINISKRVGVQKVEFALGTKSL